MIRFQQFTLARGTKPLFDNATFTLNPGEKAGLIGANGAGKSTLFSVLLGRLHPDGGDASFPPTWQVAHVSQETPAVARTAVEYTLDGDAELREIEARIAAASASGDGEADALAHGAYADADGYTAASRAETLLAGLGFSQAEMHRPVTSFSGGWRMRLNLAQALMCRSDLLLLDEPTNHLDLDAIVWLEDWLRRYSGTIVVISHDREFLDAVTNVTLHLENRQIKRYGGNYTQFETQRAQHILLQQSAYAKQQKTVAHLQHFIDRFKAKATKARQAQSRVKALERIEMIAPVYASSPFTFSFREPDRAPNPMLVVEDVDCGYGPRVAEDDHGDVHATPVTPTDGEVIRILGDVNLSIQNEQRIGLLGANGQGKSTLIKTLFGELAPLQGEVRRGKGLVIGYFAQHQLETLREDDSPLMHLTRIAGGAREQELRNFLGSFNFHGDMATSPVRPFSGGEKARLALALIIWTKPNLLLLDEPTNHLDLETRHALTTALAQFDGTLILVSHDRHLLRATTDAFLLVGDGKVAPFDGDLDDYKRWLLDATKARAQGGAAPKPAKTSAEGNRQESRADEKMRGVTRPAAPTSAPPAPGEPAASSAIVTRAAATPGPVVDPAARKEQRKLDAQARQHVAAQRKPLQKRIETLERELEKLNTEKAGCDAFIADPGSYEAQHKAALTETLRRQGELAARIGAVETDWMAALEALEMLDATITAAS
ncbi:ATP-binding cassette domain-containing protein [Robbsia andropogonis]|uniref:ATP-binding cassette domain-containing protein n=1 Tax=Robbsia andropogonis TaxID=28092 RepID=UPI002A6A054F|nr:ATP-binding cassette domain-containing protein [Robbsia andropogonis]